MPPLMNGWMIKYGVGFSLRQESKKTLEEFLEEEEEKHRKHSIFIIFLRT